MTDTAQSDRQPIPTEVFCPQCGYDLRGASGDNCSECGYGLAGLRSLESVIPWVHRKAQGRFRAFWRTVWFVTFHNRRFCEEYARSVSYSDAQRFRWVTILHAFVPMALMAIALVMTANLEPQAVTSTFPLGLPPEIPLIERARAEVWPLAGLTVCFFLFLAAATGIPSYFIHPKRVPVERQNAVIAMSYYTCGPLALATVLFAVAAGFHLLPLSVLQVPSTYPDPHVLLAGTVVGGMAILTWWLNLVRLAGRTMPQLPPRRVLVGTLVPVAWTLLAGLTLVALPMALLGVLLVFASLS